MPLLEKGIVVLCAVVSLKLREHVHQTAVVVLQTRVALSEQLQT